MEQIFASGMSDEGRELMASVTDKSVLTPSDNPICDWQMDSTPTHEIKTQPEQDLSELVGKHIIYSYANGWHYEYYFRNEGLGDYRIASGMVADRWTTHQKLLIAALGNGTYKFVWNEPTGTTCALDINFRDRWLHGTIVFPQWIKQNPKGSVCHQNLHLPKMREQRDAGPIYPVFVDNNFAEITFMEDCGRDNDDVIKCAASELPEGYLDRKN
jgi:phenolic acid decarboxylase